MSPQEETLRKQIEAVGAPDRYVDADEEAGVFEQGKTLGFDTQQVEMLLNQMCRQNDWTREKDVVQDLYDQLEEATKDDGVISKGEFEHAVNYGVAMHMPRQRATDLSVRYILQK